MNLGGFLEIVVLVSAVLLVLLILVQQRGATLGAGTGGSSTELYTTRRGLEKSLFITTIVMSVIFVTAILGLLIIPE